MEHFLYILTVMLVGLWWE